MRIRLLSILSVFALWLLLPAAMLAQGERGAITGTVTDASGAAIPHVEVIAQETQTGVESKAVTTDVGLYRIPYLPPGIYRVSAGAAGFKTAVIERVEVAVASVVTANLTLEVGAVNESVTVSAEATHLESSTSELGYSVSEADYHAWPIDSNDDGQRQIQSFIFNSLPGTSGDSYQGTINGGPQFSHEVLIEGMSIGRADVAGDTAEYTPSVDAISEFTLQTGALSAQYGGGLTAVANFNVKSGTNEFHGSAYDYVVNDALNANSFDNNAFGTPKSPFKQNSFGANLGGPVTIPKIYNGKNKTFFFFSYEGARKRNYSPTALRNLPTQNFKEGDFSQMLDPSFTGSSASGTSIVDGAGNAALFGAIYDPHSTVQLPDGSYSRTQFPGNLIPPTDISTVSANILKLAPIPNPLLSSLLRNYPGVANQPWFDLNTYGGKLDHSFNSKHRMAVFVNSNERLRYNGAGHAYEPIPGSATGTFALQDILGTMIRATEDWTISPNWLNHFGFGYNRFKNANSSITLNQGWPDKIGLDGVQQTTFPLITFTGPSTLSGTMNQMGRNNAGVEPNGSYIVQNDTTWVHSAHNIRFGLEIRKYYYDQDYRGGTSGGFKFSNDQTADPTALASTGNAFASFLLGAPYSTSLNISPVNPASHFWNPAFYIADDWKVSHRLTLNMGFRWDIVGALTEAQNRSSGLDPTLANPGADGYPGALVFLSQLHRGSFQNTYWKEFGPRFGFAYQLNSRMVLRGGYGIMYSPPIANQFGLASIDGYDGSHNYSASTRDPRFYWDNGYPAYNFTLPDLDPTLDNGQSVAYIPSNSNRQPYSQNYTLGFQFLLPKDTTLMASYVGNKGTRLGASGLNNLNQLNPKYLSLGDELLDDVSQHPDIPLPYPSFSGTVAQALLPYPQYGPGGVYYFFPYFGTSHYDAAQVVVNHRTGKGLSFLVSYAFQKTISLTDSNLYGYTNGSQDVYNRQLERSVAGFDHTQQLKVTWIYELPFGKGRTFLNQGGLVNQVLGGWTVTGIQTYQSGDPLSFSSGIDTSGYLFNVLGDVRPDVLSGVALKVPSGQQGAFDYAGGNGQAYINTAAFAPPPTTPNGVVLRLGTAPREFGNLRGPWQPMESFGLFKRFPFREAKYLEFRADFINAFNRAGRADPDTNLSDPTFGRILDVADGPREIQLALRLTF
ncbi:MAG TPA: TonB-dependent receptor [Bryobacteraceae bacterium]|nr:TonB-dependent receptor [Bryobacteraceae bacterium]